MDAYIVWTCSKCKKENEENIDMVDIHWHKELYDTHNAITIELQCTTCGTIDKHERKI